MRGKCITYTGSPPTIVPATHVTFSGGGVMKEAVYTWPVGAVAVCEEGEYSFVRLVGTPAHARVTAETAREVAKKIAEPWDAIQFVPMEDK